MIRNGKIPPLSQNDARFVFDMDPDLASILRQMLQHHPDMRVSASQVLSQMRDLFKKTSDNEVGALLRSRVAEVELAGGI